MKAGRLCRRVFITDIMFYGYRLYHIVNFFFGTYNLIKIWNCLCHMQILAFTAQIPQSRFQIENKYISKTMQNIIVLMDQPKSSFDISFKAGIMCLNRFCIDEDAAFEIIGIYGPQQLWYIPLVTKGKVNSTIQVIRYE